jgi:hypothetical protein
MSLMRGGGGDDFVGKQVGACPLRPVVAGCGDEEFSGRIEVMGIPSGAEHALYEDRVDAPGLADAETYPQVHPGTYCALAHGLLRRPLGGRDKGNSDTKWESRPTAKATNCSPRWT